MIEWLIIGSVILNVLLCLFIIKIVDFFLKSKKEDMQDFKNQMVKLTEDYKNQINLMADRFMSFNVSVFENFKNYESEDKELKQKSILTNLEGKAEPEEELQDIADKYGKKISTVDDLEQEKIEDMGI